MSGVLHLIDKNTPADMLHQLGLLGGADDVIASVGTLPQHEELAGRAVAIRAAIAPWIVPPSELLALTDNASAIHTWSPAAGRAGWALAYRCDIPLVHSAPSAPPPKWIHWAKGKMARHTFKLTVPTAAARRKIVAAGIDKEMVHLLPPPAQMSDDAAGQRQRVREQLALEPEHIAVIAPGEMRLHAGHKTAIWAWAIVRQVYSNLRLLIPGAGPAERHVRFFADATGYPGEIMFTGQRFGCSELLAGADVGLFFCQRDCGPAALAAAMAAGIPIAGSRTADIAECAPHEQAALLSDPGQPRTAAANLLRLIEEPQLASSLGAAAKQIAKTRFTVEAVRARLTKIYEAAAAPASA
ncbi:MAG: glycosyltransferase family 4 protein [Phycisphaerae bacterium]|nr:glycosyltransferase family 4 protein [Phycisphaerae bacterium]